MQAKLFQANVAETKVALTGLSDQIAKGGEAPDAGFIFYGCDHDAAEIHAALKQQFPAMAILGGSSSGGTIDTVGVSEATALSILCLYDADGEYGSGGRALGDDPANAAKEALNAALEAAGCPGQMPEMLWVYQAPGKEEAVLAGLQEIVGPDCPIFGGSSADNDVSGQWTQLADDGAMSDGVVVAALFPSGETGFAFQGGYEPAGMSGVITKTGERGASREIVEIDGRPAAEVYNGWIGNAIEDQMGGGNVLAQTTLYPLGVDTGKVDGVVQYLLIHPETVTERGALTTFANLETGTRIHCMKGDRTKLTTRAGDVVSQAVAQLETSKPAAALVVYCGGCRLAVGDAVGEVHDSISQVLPKTPFVGTFTFGEQGSLLDRNMHGNLMFSAVVFGDA